MLSDYWDFVQEYYTPEESDEFWAEMLDAGNRLAEKYGNDKFIIDIVLAHINKVERNHKDGN